MNKLLVCKIICCLFFCLFFTSIGTHAETDEQVDEESSNELYEDDLLEHISTQELQRFWTDIYNEYGTFMPDGSEKNLKQMIKQQGQLSLPATMKGIFAFLLYEVMENGKLLGTLIMLTMFSAILQSIHQSFEKSAVSKIAYFIVYIVLIYITLNSFMLVFQYAKQTIESMSDFMIALLPLMLGLLASFGQVISVSFFHPIIIFLIHFSGMLVTNFVFPLLYLSMLLLIISGLNEQFQATHLADLFKTISVGSLGVFLSLFLGVISVQGTASAIQDGVALKTTKFITGNFIPVVGGTFTDAADTVLASLLLLKNAIGIVGLTIIVFIAVFPTLKILVISFIYKLAAALLQPLGNSPIIKSLTIISKYMMYILACVITVTFMFFLAIVIIVISSNIPLLLR
jgi:stage III sporulation protein AE